MSLHLPKCHIVGNHVSWLKFIIIYILFAESVGKKCLKFNGNTKQINTCFHIPLTRFPNDCYSLSNNMCSLKINNSPLPYRYTHWS